MLGPVPGVIGTLQALECIKVISGVGNPLSQVRTSRRFVIFPPCQRLLYTSQLSGTSPPINCLMCRVALQPVGYYARRAFRFSYLLRLVFCGTLLARESHVM